MKKYRTLILPLILLAAIFLAGCLSPTLFSLLSPDFKDQIENVEITDVKSPLYLENTDRLVLPPWNRFSTQFATDFRETYPGRIHIDFLSDFNVRINHWISTFYPEAKPEKNVLYSGLIDHLKVAKSMFSDSGEYITTYLFLQEYWYKAVDGHTYILDLVVDENEWAPLYLHIRRSSADTAPLNDDAPLRRSFQRLAHSLQNGDLDPQLLAEKGVTEELVRSITVFSIMYLPDHPYIPPLLQTLSAQLVYPDITERPQPVTNYTASAWLEALYEYRNIYTMVYSDETMLVLSDEQNRTYCIFYDSVSNRPTGFCVDVEPDESVSESSETASDNNRQNYFIWMCDFSSPVRIYS